MGEQAELLTIQLINSFNYISSVEHVAGEVAVLPAFGGVPGFWRIVLRFISGSSAAETKSTNHHQHECEPEPV